MKINTFTKQLILTPLKRLKLILIFFLFSSLLYSSNNFNKSPLPSWVKQVDFKNIENTENSGGFQYLLIDLQENIINKSTFGHYAIKVLNSEGIQSMSNIDITFDPSYQKLYLHQIQIIRDGKIINKFNDSNIRTIQRETSLERSLYDGSLSTIINLTDIRENDIIEYSYTVNGFNPINKGDYSTTFYHQYTIPVNRVYNRVITNKQHELQFKLYNGAIDPEINTSNNKTEYIWDVEALDFKIYDINVPSWYDSHRSVSFSSYKNWGAIVDWALPLYKYDEADIKEINLNLKKVKLKEDKLLAIIKFVQDDIRYLGFESGINAYKPHKPKKVFEQRYGDCKDKSLLLVSLLRKEGVESYPLLINTQLKDELKERLPAGNIFDHCVVYFKHKNKDYFIDPTISNQGGNLQNISFPNYRYGLLLKPGENDLFHIPDTEKATVKVNEIIYIDSIGSYAELEVSTEYTGNKADYIRSYFNTNHKESIQKEYLNYYSNLYPNIELTKGIDVLDHLRNSTNKIIIEEHYKINNFWLDTKDKSSIYCEIYPLVLESLVNYPNSADRKMPYQLGNIHSYSQNTNIYLPEVWAIENSEKRVEGDGFVYENSVKGYGKSISITHNYEITKEYITENKVDQFLKKHDNIKNEFSYFLTYNTSLSGFELSWISILLVIIALIVGVYFSIRIYKNYNPNPIENPAQHKIGGWLILPAIGISLSPFFLLTQLFSEEHFNQNSWVGIYNSGYENLVSIYIFFGAEIVYNFLFFIFSILIIVLFFQKRSNIPVLISVYYLLSFLIPLLDTLVSNQLIPGQILSSENDELYKSIGKSFLGAVIWIPYFNFSERVKNTFVKKHKIVTTT
ncbi:DUF3857 domain-containing protein [Lutibacter sp.]|uniref:DUF3857 domain-containing protein n=1 Tax=Lutibacter sp. TaxID=1925666 RepID=UPI0035651798